MTKFWNILKQLFALFIVYRQGKKVATEEIQQQAEIAYHEHTDKIQETLQAADTTIVASYNDSELRRRMREQCTVSNKKNSK